MTVAPAPAAATYLLGRFRFDAGQGLLLAGREAVDLPPRALRLLALFAARAGELLDRDGLVRRLWPTSVVEEAQLAKLVYQLRRVFGDDCIETHPRRGYRWTGPVRRLGSLQREVVAVLPFACAAGSRIDAAVGEGLADELLAALARVPSLGVVARSSAFVLAERNAQSVAALVAASLVVEGLLHRERERLLLDVRIVDGHDGSPRWSTRIAGEVDALQAMGSKVVRAVAHELAPGDPAGGIGDAMVSERAHALHLEGRYWWSRRPGRATQRALECLREAVRIAPGFAGAWASLADAEATLGSWEASALEPRESQRLAAASAQRALSLDPGNAQAHATLAYLQLHYGQDAAGALAGFERAIRLDPQAAASHHWHAHALVASGRFAEARVASLLAKSIDPVNLLMSAHLAWHHFMAREHDLALLESERVIGMDAGYHWGHYFRAWGLEALGEPGRAVESMREAVASSEGDAVMRMGLVRALCVAGERGAALALLAEVDAWRAGRQLLAYERALAWLALGDADQAFDLLEQARQDHSGWMAYLAVDPRLDPLRTQARFDALLGQINPESPHDG